MNQEGTGIMKSIDEVVDDILNTTLKIEVKVDERERSRYSGNGNNYRGYFSKPKIYIWPEDESILDNLMNRRSRPYQFYRKEVLPEVFKQLGWDPDTKVRWSQYAGCTCPCSPGFRIQDWVTVPSEKWDDEQTPFFDVHVTVSYQKSEAPPTGFAF